MHPALSGRLALHIAEGMGWRLPQHTLKIMVVLPLFILQRIIHARNMAIIDKGVRF